MHFNQILAITATLVAIVLSVVVYLNSENGTTWEKSEWTVVNSTTGEAQTWYVDLDQGIRMVTEADGGMHHVQDFVGGESFTYDTVGTSLNDVDHSRLQCRPDQGVNCDALRQLLAMDFSLLAEGVKDRKTSCHVEETPFESPVAVKNGSLSIAGFELSVVDNVPVALISNGVVTHEITSVTAYTEDIVINGCTAEDDKMTRSMMEVSEDNHNRMLAEGSAYTSDLLTARQYLDYSYSNFSTEQKSERQLQFFTVSNALWILSSGSNWCGPGTIMDMTRCWIRRSDPARRVTQGDNYCYRHDHAGSSHPYMETVLTSCEGDDHITLGDMNFLALLFGSCGVSGSWGCVNWKRHRYLAWRWNSRWWGGYWSLYWRWTGFYRGIITGVFRYNSYVSYGYHERIGQTYVGFLGELSDASNGGGVACYDVYTVMGNHNDVATWNLTCPSTQAYTKQWNVAGHDDGSVWWVNQPDGSNNYTSCR